MVITVIIIIMVIKTTTSVIIRITTRQESGEETERDRRREEEIERRAKKKKQQQEEEEETKSKIKKKENGDMEVSEKDRSGKEGQDLLKPPYNTDFDQGKVQDVSPFRCDSIPIWSLTFLYFRPLSRSDCLTEPTARWVLRTG